jgi:hypothetical protein
VTHEHAQRLLSLFTARPADLARPHDAPWPWCVPRSQPQDYIKYIRPGRSLSERPRDFNMLGRLHRAGGGSRLTTQRQRPRDRRRDDTRRAITGRLHDAGKSRAGSTTSPTSGAGCPSSLPRHSAFFRRSRHRRTAKRTWGRDRKAAFAPWPEDRAARIRGSR